ncbi:hypothetical protein CCACVL1_31058 [Corchorus capsularis]|uniref:Uncharacterized protein n=1 Tax=Corchorus capsularis TaxID=210143 RepID=A0A1R3FUB6_COCAP|nr:hypothetical protein CCACVL1_31058 [Corchorus capsularis]
MAERAEKVHEVSPGPRSIIRHLLVPQ